MKRFIVVFLSGMMIGILFMAAKLSVADTGDRPVEYIFNRVWNSTTNILRITGR